MVLFLLFVAFLLLAFTEAFKILLDFDLNLLTLMQKHLQPQTFLIALFLSAIAQRLRFS